MVFADEALPDTHSPKQSAAAVSAVEGILHNRGERALVRSGGGGGAGGEVERLNAFDKTRPLDDREVIRKRSRTSEAVHHALVLGAQPLLSFYRSQLLSLRISD